MKKKICILASALIISANMTTVVYASSHQPATDLEIVSPSGDVRADVIVRKYRTYKGMLQVRNWNETRGFWVDDWRTIGVAS